MRQFAIWPFLSNDHWGPSAKPLTAEYLIHSIFVFRTLHKFFSQKKKQQLLVRLMWSEFLSLKFYPKFASPESFFF